MIYFPLKHVLSALLHLLYKVGLRVQNLPNNSIQILKNQAGNYLFFTFSRKIVASDCRSASSDRRPDRPPLFGRVRQGSTHHRIPPFPAEPLTGHSFREGLRVVFWRQIEKRFVQTASKEGLYGAQMGPDFINIKALPPFLSTKNDGGCRGLRTGEAAVASCLFLSNDPLAGEDAEPPSPKSFFFEASYAACAEFFAALALLYAIVAANKSSAASL